MENYPILNVDYKIINSGPNGKIYYVHDKEVADALNELGLLNNGDRLYVITTSQTLVKYDDGLYVDSNSGSGGDPSSSGFMFVPINYEFDLETEEESATLTKTYREIEEAFLNNKIIIGSTTLQHPKVEGQYIQLSLVVAQLGYQEEDSAYVILASPLTMIHGDQPWVFGCESKDDYPSTEHGKPA